jgi:hypothetical protein
LRIYCCGPMSGIKAFNIPAFDEAAKALRVRGYDVVSPAELDEPEFRAWCLASEDGDISKAPKHLRTTWGELLARDVKMIADEGIEAIVCLEGWKESRGACLETFVGRQCGLPIYSYGDYSYGDVFLYWVHHHDLYDAHGPAQDFDFYDDFWDAEIETEPTLTDVEDAEFLNIKVVTGYIAVPESMLNDCGEGVREFDTGATRDTADGKFDFEGYLSPRVLWEFARYMTANREMPDGSLRASDNWQKGIPLDVYMKSLLRHVMDLWLLHRGVEEHRPEDGKFIELHDTLGGALFNLQGYWHETLNGGNNHG